jgi:MOSC domain-containing protein YiiM
VADTIHHGGPRKAVYAYPSEHYPAWCDELGLASIPWGGFGENLTVRGVTEDDVRPGDRLEIGDAVLEVTIPRTPCFKLNIRFGRDDMVRRLARSGRCGFYLGVVRPGSVEAGDPVRVHPVGPAGPTIAGLFRPLRERAADPSLEYGDE